MSEPRELRVKFVHQLAESHSDLRSLTRVAVVSSVAYFEAESEKDLEAAFEQVFGDGVEDGADVNDVDVYVRAGLLHFEGEGALREDGPQELADDVLEGFDVDVVVPQVELNSDRFH